MDSDDEEAPSKREGGRLQAQEYDDRGSARSARQSARSARRPREGGRRAGHGPEANSGRKRVKKELNRQLHRNWSFANKFLIILVVIYAVPTVAELYYGANYGDGCEAGLHYWMFIDAFVTAVFMFTQTYAAVRMHLGLQADPELENYLLSGGRNLRDEQQEEILETKYTLLHKKSHLLPRSLTSVPFFVSLVGIFLWVEARGNEETCSDTLITATGWIALMKTLAPIVIGAVYGCSFLFLMTGANKKRADKHTPSDDLGDEDANKDFYAEQELELTYRNASSSS